MQEETMLEKLKTPSNSSDVYDLVIIGAGPSGLSAALCAGRASLKTLLIEKAIPGGQVLTAYNINNYLGFPGGILGEDLGKQFEKQLENYAIDRAYETVEQVINISSSEKTVKTDLGNSYKTKAIIISVGLEPKQLGAQFENKFLGRGVSYYALSDVEAYRGKDVAVMGGGNCACYAADYLSEYVNQLYLIHKSDDIKAVKKLKERILNNPKINVIWNSSVIDVFGIDKVEKVKVQNLTNDQHTWIDVKGLFIYVGRMPPSEFVSLELEVDEEGYLVTDDYMRTNIPGVYAAGDIRSKQIRQIATAVSDGMVAAINVERDLFR